jgi:hypothetical protein
MAQQLYDNFLPHNAVVQRRVFAARGKLCLANAHIASDALHFTVRNIPCTLFLNGEMHVCAQHAGKLYGDDTLGRVACYVRACLAVQQLRA